MEKAYIETVKRDHKCRNCDGLLKKGEMRGVISSRSVKGYETKHLYCLGCYIKFLQWKIDELKKDLREAKEALNK